MKRFIFITCLLITLFTQAQNTTRSIVEFSPSKATKVNGLSIKYWYVEDLNYTKQINGIELGLNPISVFMPFLTTIHSLNPFEIDAPPPLSGELNKVVNGLQFSIGNLEKTKVNGLEINLSGGINTITNGISISPNINKHYSMRGISIAPLGNMDNSFRGIQIGLVNKTNNSKGIQIGLWNVNEKRSLPFINWNF